MQPLGAVGSTHLQIYDRGTSSSVLVLHGFTGSAAAMEGLSEPLSANHRVVTADLPGHGASAAPTLGYTMADVVDDIAEIVLSLELAPVHLVGYSMGGRIALSYAVTHGSDLRSLFLIGASAGLAMDRERRRRCQADDALADQIEERGMEWFANYWSSQPLLQPVTDRGAVAANALELIRKSHDPVGQANALRALGVGRMPPVHDELGQIRIPTALLAGSEDVRYVTIASEMKVAMPCAEMFVLQDAGHAAHLDAPSEVVRIALDFFAEVEASSR